MNPHFGDYKILPFAFFVPCRGKIPHQQFQGNSMTTPTTEHIIPLCDVVRQTEYDLRKYHGHGHLEKV